MKWTKLLLALLLLSGCTAKAEVPQAEAVEVVVEEEHQTEFLEHTEDIIYLGEFRLTAYCPCEECSEGYGHQTATGAYATEGVTIAVDPSVIPYGTQVCFLGHEWIAQDCGGAINENRIDVFVEEHCDTFRDEYNQWVDVYMIVRYD